ncbi:hypothetical protein ACPPVT_11705 [Angustibacter sp. McL0619]|uniref:hypothetical protein n=1 Tax=Angustibacter sp. McL0619 TaxID=3415676 RepID=UPI003CF3F418
MSILLDAGPALNFLAVGQENVLIQTAASHRLQLATAARVDNEVTGMAKDARFYRTAVKRTWQTLKSTGRLEVLVDDTTDRAFGEAIERLSGVPAEVRVRTRKSLGEIMVLAHASVLAQAGADAFVLIDDGDARKRARTEADWLVADGTTGVLRVWSTRQVLSQADPAWITDKQTWQRVYTAMRAFDDGLAALPA